MAKRRKACRAVDLDSTLAYYEKYVSPTHIGEPIEKMLNKVKYWLQQGDDVWIFTARADPTEKTHKIAIAAIEDWCVKHIGKKLGVTAIKSKRFSHFYDDRAQQVIKNEGTIVFAPDYNSIVEKD
jgi:hypothetical protein